MKFVKFGDAHEVGSLQPADEEARIWLMQAKHNDEIELAAGRRTPAQLRAIWLYCERLAEALNAAGFDQINYPFRDGLSIPFSKSSVMEIFFRPVMDALTGKKSTGALSIKEVNEIYEALDKAMSERTGVRVEFPSND